MDVYTSAMRQEMAKQLQLNIRLSTRSTSSLRLFNPTLCYPAVFSEKYEVPAILTMPCSWGNLGGNLPARVWTGTPACPSTAGYTG